MGKILAVCISTEKGTAKRRVERAEFIINHGIKDDAHAGPWHRQVSLLSHEKIKEFRAKGAAVEDGAFGENLIVEGIDFRSLSVGTILECNNVLLEMTQIGKECHSHCAIFKVMGDCIMPREGVFAIVVKGGFIGVGDEMNIKQDSPGDSTEFSTPAYTATSVAASAAASAAASTAVSATASAAASVAANAAASADSSAPYRVWIIVASDKGFTGNREDLSGPVIRDIVSSAGYEPSGYTLLPDDQDGIEKELKRICDNGLAELILTSGGTGFSKRDCVPEATMAVAARLAPGIAEAMRAQSMAITKRAMLSRAVSAIRGNTLIVNLPGSPRAAMENLEFVLPELHHGLDILCGRDGECGS